MNIGAAEIILILLVAFVIVGPKDLPKVARALGRFVKYIRGMVEEVKRELGVENVEADLKTLDREVKDTVKDLDIRQDLQKTQLDMNKEFKKMTRNWVMLDSQHGRQIMAKMILFGEVQGILLAVAGN